MTMGSFGTDVPAASPTNDPEEPGAKTSARSASGGGYSKQAIAALERAGYPGAEHPGKGDPFGPGETAPGSDLFERPGAGLSGV
jgi:hypothetical protein